MLTNSLLVVLNLDSYFNYNNSNISVSGRRNPYHEAKLVIDTSMARKPRQLKISAERI
jgi:hypothetical protein